jgi:hypothetical protein
VDDAVVRRVARGREGPAVLRLGDETAGVERAVVRRDGVDADARVRPRHGVADEHVEVLRRDGVEADAHRDRRRRLRSRAVLSERGRRHRHGDEGHAQRDDGRPPHRRVTR